MKGNPQLFAAGMPLMPLFGSASEEAKYDSGGSRIVVLMQVNAERGPVVVDIEQTDVYVPGGVEATPRCLSLAWT